MRGAALAASKPRPASRPMTRLVQADSLVIGYLLAVFVLTAAAAVGLAAYLHQQPRAGEMAPFMVGSTVLDVPVNWLRIGSPAGGGRVERLDLVIPWPGDTRAPPADGPAAAAEAQAIDRVVLVSLTPADATTAPADRPAQLYARFLNAEVWPNPGGLILRRFRTGTPYEDEDLYVSPPDGRAFAARCPRGGAAGLKEGCVAEIRVGSVDAQLRFAATRLVTWERLAEGARRAIAGMTRTQL